MLLLVILAGFGVGVARAEIGVPQPEQGYPISISAEAANRWQQGSYEVWLLKGHCRIVQGRDVVECQEAALWIDHALPGSRQPSKVIAYLEGNVALALHRRAAVRVTDKTWFGRFFTSGSIDIQAAVVAGRPDVLPGIYQRGMERRNPEFVDSLRQTHVEQAQFVAPPQPQAAAPLLPPLPGRPGDRTPSKAPSPGAQLLSGTAAGAPAMPGTRRVRVFPRGDVPVQAQWFPDPRTNQWIAVIDQGVNLIVDGLKNYGAIDVSTDRLVIWTTGTQEPDLRGQASQDDRTPMEIYMEGNVVFRQGERIVYADRMYYDVPNHVGTVLNADVLTPAPTYEGKVRLHAEVLQQTDQDHFFAKHAFFTSSRMGSPGYRIEAGDVDFEDHQRPIVDAVTGQPLTRPGTAEPAIEHDATIKAWNDVFYFEGLPIFYWPVIAADLNDPTYYIRRASFKQDSVFGTQFFSDWNMYQLLGIHHPPAGTEWDISLDYLSLRGFGFGTSFLYHRDQLFGVPGAVAGMADFWGIDDKGFDNLGIDRSHVKPDQDFRYRFLWNHRQQLSEELELSVEAGKVSDRNFLEEYYKREWDELKDESTDVELKWRHENMSLSLFAGVRLDDFFTETEWLPRLDHYWLGQSLLSDTLTWYEHSSAGYAEFRTASLPNASTGDQAVTHLPWEAENRQGGRFVTRNEFDYPVQLGPVKVVPYLLGELGYWGEDLSGQSVNRAYYQAGLRATLPIWSVDPTVESALWNVHGLAHKVEFEAEYSHSQTNVDLGKFPLYDPLDDNQIEAFRRRFVINTFGPAPTPLPPFLGPPKMFDERYYALRSGLGDWVTSPSMEIAGDLDALRLAVNQRWQTKRGPPDDRHIVDWIELDTNATFFPNPDRDNFGSIAGLVQYNFIWHVGDRLSVVSDGIFDCFDDGQRIVNVGVFLTRPPRGAIYAGFRILEGPINDHIFSASYSYWMSPKWISSLGFSTDLNDTRNTGESLRITRVGESLLVSAAFSVDPVRNTVTAGMTVEPRFMPKGKLGQLPGVHVPPAGAFGLE